ncbi:MAG TPA: hypothetical protein VFX61_05615 [Micromonosporaceae bacterium]|nr:hypothetical protein [Micromonosporaceae bacterium]
MKLPRAVRRFSLLLALASMVGIIGLAQPANAFTSSSSITLSGNTYSVQAYSCNLYVTSCDWSATARSTYSRSFTHYGEVKANGINVTVTISASPSVTISGNSTSLASAKRTLTGTYNYMSGVAKPSIFSVSVAARSRLVNSAVSLNSGWTTW